MMVSSYQRIPFFATGKPCEKYSGGLTQPAVLPCHPEERSDVGISRYQLPSYSGPVIIATFTREIATALRASQ